MTAIPLYCFVAGDSLGVLVLVNDHDTVAELALRAQQAAAVRVAPRPHNSLFAQCQTLVSQGPG